MEPIAVDLVDVRTTRFSGSESDSDTPGSPISFAVAACKVAPDPEVDLCRGEEGLV
jgi:hypothetical protein